MPPVRGTTDEDEGGMMHEFARSLGRIEERLDGFVDRYTSDRQDTLEQRRELHEAITTLSHSINIVPDLAKQLSDLSKRIDSIEKDVDDYRERRAEVRGAAKFATWAKGAVLFLVSIAAALIGYWLRQRPEGL